MITGILTAAAIIGLIGILVGLFLGFAGLKLHVEVDEKEEAILEALPGNNCGGCGYAGCEAAAAAIAKGEAPTNACPVGGEETASKVAAILGQEATQSRRMVAFVHCKGDCEKTHTQYDYTGTQDCRIMAYVPGGGPKSCDSGCLGYGSCVKECPFNAIHIVNGIAQVDREACRACGKCVAVCPKKLIELIPYDAQQVVACSSRDKGPVTMKACDVGCIGCGLCVRNCPNGAVKIVDFHAVIDYDKCEGCGVCEEKCPRKSIIANG